MIWAERLELVLDEMQQAGLDMLICLSGDMHPFQQTNPVALLSGARVVGESFVALEVSGESTLVVSPDWEEDRVRVHSHTSKTVGCEDIRAQLLKTIQNSAKVGFAGLNTLSYATANWMSEAFKGALVPFDAELKYATRRKTSMEIERARRATEIAEYGYDLMLRVASIGMSEIELATEVCTAMTGLGADDNFIMLSASPHNRAVRPPGARRLEDGDLILCEISPSFEGQFSQICRTTVIGDMPEILPIKYALLQEAVRNGVGAAKPGVTVGTVVEAINANLIAAGYGAFCAPPHMRARGHGLGFGSVDPGDLAAGCSEVIDHDMVFVIHPNQYMPETGYMMCGEPVVVTGQGATFLSSHTATLDQICSAG